MVFLPFSNSQVFSEEKKEEEPREPVYLTLFEGNIIKSQGRELLALNAETGKQLWKATLADKLVVEPTAFNGKVVAPIANKRTTIIESKTGKILASYIWPAILSTPITFTKSNAFFGLSDGTFYCTTPDFKKIIWRQVLIKGEFQLGKSTFDKFGNLFLLTNKNNILSVDSKKGKLLWKTNAGVKVIPEIHYANDMLYMGSDSKIFKAYFAKDGKKAWEYSAKGDFECGVTLGVGNKLYVGNTDKNLYCLDQKTGKKLFEHTSQGEVKTTPVICSDRVFFASSNGRFYCIDAVNGQKIITAPTRLDCNPVASDKYVYYIFRDILICAKPDLKFVWNHIH
jgi:outer membrane protein assembly factor BamB